MPQLITQLKDSIINNMTEGVLIVGFNGMVLYANPAALNILDVSDEKIIGRSFADVFFRQSQNDRFVDAVADAFQERRETRTCVVPYYTDETEKHLRMTISIFRDSIGNAKGFTIVLGDLSELMELKDEVKAMEYIDVLNRQLQERNELLNKTFGMFLSDDVVKELLNKPDGLSPGGKKRSVTIMMSDLRGFTAISEKMDAEELISMLNHYLKTMTEVIQRWSGTIIEFMGDGILTVFGAPVEYELHVSGAVACALEMQQAMEEINRWNTERNLPHLEMGIGIDTGEVIIGNIGSERRMKYGVVGKHVNLCSRIESYTVGGQILISSDVRDQMESPLTIEKEMTVLPKGADHEVILFHVTGIGEPYNIRITASSDAPKKLNTPLPVIFYRMDGKHTMDKACYGGILAVGRDCVILETETNLELFDNLQMQTGGRLLCKVMEKKSRKYLLHFTYIPSGYEAWIDDTLARNGEGDKPL